MRSLKTDIDYPVVTLCGSTRFKDEFLFMQKLLTLKKYIVLTVGLFGHSGDEITEEQKIMLDDMHKTKIQMADLVFVIDKNGYIGDSTSAEIKFANSLNIPILYYSKEIQNL